MVIGHSISLVIKGHWSLGVIGHLIVINGHWSLMVIKLK